MTAAAATAFLATARLDTRLKSLAKADERAMNEEVGRLRSEFRGQRRTRRTLESSAPRVVLLACVCVIDLRELVASRRRALLDLPHPLLGMDVPHVD